MNNKKIFPNYAWNSVNYFFVFVCSLFLLMLNHKSIFEANGSEHRLLGRRVSSTMVLPSSRPELLLKMNLLRRKWNLHRANHRTTIVLTFQQQTLGNPLSQHTSERPSGGHNPLQIEDLIPYTVIISTTILVTTSMAALKMMACGKILIDG